MFSGMASLSLSSALWLTAMAANPLGAEMARTFGVEIDFGSWLIAASVPTLTAMALLPLVLYKAIAPEVTATPLAPAAARKALAALGPLRRQEKIVAVTFAGMVVLWGLAATLGLDSTAIAFLGLGVLLATGVLTAGDIAKEGDVLATFLWFAALFTLSSQLNALGFMGFVGQRLAGAMDGMAPLAAGLVLVVAYVAAPLPLREPDGAPAGALRGVPRRRREARRVACAAGVPAALCHQHFSAIAPQGSSANLLFAGSGFLSQGELYRLGALTTAFNLAIYLVVGLPWLLLVLR